MLNSVSANDQTFHLTSHALTRMAQRNVNRRDLTTVLNYGERVHRAGGAFFFLGKRNIPEDRRRNSRIAQLEGTTVFVNDGYIVTVYRDGNLRQIKRKQVYRS